MHRQLTVLNGDNMNRLGHVFTLGALEGPLYDNALHGIPALLSHDRHRPIGWQFPRGLYFEPGLTRLVGEFIVPETEAEQNQVMQAHYNALLMRHAEDCKPYLDEFENVLGNHASESSRYLYNGCVACHDQGIFFKIYPELETCLDKDGLLYLDDLLKKFEYLGQGIFKDRKEGWAIFCHSFFRRNLSRINSFHDYFLDQFIALQGNSDIRLRIAIDRDMVGLSKTFHPYFEYEYWWGPKYTDNIAEIRTGVTEFLCDDQQKMFSGISGTEFWWKTDKHERIFEVEEIRDIPSKGIGNEHYGCRYVHSIYDTDKMEFGHFDGAIRMYPEEKMLERLSKKIDRAGKQSEYTKLFRIDGKLQLSDWKSLTTNYFQENPLLYEYFGVKDEHQKIISEIQPRPSMPVRNYIPYGIEKENGVRLFVSYQRPHVQTIQADRTVIISDWLSARNGESIPVVEFGAIEVRKILQRSGHQLTFPKDVTFIKARDRYTNYPMILHAAKNLEANLLATLQAYRLIFDTFKDSDNRAAFTLAWPMGDRDVVLSVLGPVSELHIWLASIGTIPVQREGLQNWLNTQKKFLMDNYTYPSEGPNMYDLINSDGVLSINRKLIDPDWVTLSKGENGLTIDLTVPEGQSQIAQLMRSNQMTASVLYAVRKVMCSRTGDDYLSSSTSKILDEDVYPIIEKSEALSVFWKAPED